MATLSTHVHVTDADGVSHVFGPAEDVPEWAEALITNPKAWAEPPTEKRIPVDASPKKAPARRRRSADAPVHSN